MFVKLPGYLIRASSITGVSDVKTVEKEIDKEKKIVSHISLFFDGNSLEWFLDNPEEATKIRESILEGMLKI
jgi:hypothetical protein